MRKWIAERIGAGENLGIAAGPTGRLHPEDPSNDGVGIRVQTGGVPDTFARQNPSLSKLALPTICGAGAIVESGAAADDQFARMAARQSRGGGQSYSDWW